MAADSSTPGFLAPETFPDYDESLDDTLHDAIAGVTGLNYDFAVRPRLQPAPPNQPQADTDWCAFGVVRTYPDTYAWESFDPAGDDGQGHAVVQQDELHECLLSFFGPNANRLEMTFRLGIQVTQNREQLSAANVEVVEVRGPINLPSLLKERYVRRVDSVLVVRRRVEVTYPVRTILASGATVSFDNGIPAETIVANAASAPQSLKPPFKR